MNTLATTRPAKPRKNRTPSAPLLAFMLSTVLNAGYFLPVIYRAFFKEPLPDPHWHHYKEAPLTMVIPLCTTGLISVILGLYPALFMDFVRIFGKF